MMISNNLYFKFLFLYVFLGLMSTVDGSSTENKVTKIIYFDEKSLQGEDNPVATFMDGFNQIADAINEQDIIDYSTVTLVDTILDADNVTSVQQSTDIFNSIITVGESDSNIDDSNSNGNNMNIPNTENDDIVGSFFELFNKIADGINMALNVDGIDDILALSKVISNIFGIIDDMSQAENIIDSITGTMNTIFDVDDQSLGQDSNTEFTDSISDDSTFSSFTEFVTNIPNAITGFFDNMSEFFASFSI